MQPAYPSKLADGRTTSYGQGKSAKTPNIKPNPIIQKDFRSHDDSSKARQQNKDI